MSAQPPSSDQRLFTTKLGRQFHDRAQKVARGLTGEARAGDDVAERLNGLLSFLFDLANDSDRTIRLSEFIELDLVLRELHTAWPANGGGVVGRDQLLSLLVTTLEDLKERIEPRASGYSGHWKTFQLGGGASRVDQILAITRTVFAGIDAEGVSVRVVEQKTEEAIERDHPRFRTAFTLIRNFAGMLAGGFYNVPSLLPANPRQLKSLVFYDYGLNGRFETDFPFTEFDRELLINLAVWHRTRQGKRGTRSGASGRDRERPSSLWDRDLEQLWEEMATKQPTIVRFGEQPKEAGTRCLELEEPAADEDGDKEWAVAKRRWQRREDVLTDGHAVRFWSANNAFLHYFFRKLGWIEPARYRPRQPSSAQAAPKLVRGWARDMSLEGVLGSACRALNIELDEEVMRIAARLAFEPHVAELNELGVLFETESKADEAARAAEPNVDVDELRRNRYVPRAEVVNIGRSAAGKTSLVMSLIHRLHRANAPAVTVGELGEAEWGRYPAANSFYDLNEAWNESKQKDWVPTTSAERVNLRLSAEQLPLFKELSLHFHDFRGSQFLAGDGTRLRDGIAQDEGAGDQFKNDFAEHFQRSGVAVITIDCGDLLKLESDDGGFLQRAKVLEQFLQIADTAPKGLGERASPVMIVLTKVDRIGLHEPMSELGTLLPSLAGFDLEPNAFSSKLGSWLSHTHVSRTVQQQYLASRLLSVPAFLGRVCRASDRGSVVERLGAIFLGSGLYREAELARQEDDRLGIEKAFEWLTEHLVVELASHQLRLLAALGKSLKHVVELARETKAKLDERYADWQRAERGAGDGEGPSTADSSDAFLKTLNPWRGTELDGVGATALEAKPHLERFKQVLGRFEELERALESARVALEARLRGGDEA